MRSSRRVLACLAAVAVLGACGGGGDEKATTVEAPSLTESNLGRDAVQAPAATLRANLTGLLQEHVFLTGLVTAARFGGQDARPAQASLDRDSSRLASVIGSVYGPAVGGEFNGLWRKQTGLVLAFADATASGDKARVDQAKADLDGFRTEYATFVNRVNPNLARDAVAEDEKTFLGRLQAAVTAQFKQDPAAVGKLKEAADHTPETAAVLAVGIAKQFAKTFPGRADGSGATLRSVLTSKLEQHVYLAAMAAGAVVNGVDATGPAETLDANSVELANAVGAAYGDAASRQFLILWRNHIALVVDYARAERGGDQAGMAAARVGLDAYRAAFVAFLAAANPHLSRDQLAADLEVHVDSLLAVVDAEHTDQPNRVELVQTAADHMSDMAAALSTGLAQQFPGRFN